jgi:hypothetical protein
MEIKKFFTEETLIKFNQSLPGYIVYIMTINTKPMSLEEILIQTTPKLHLLRKGDGSVYDGNLKRSIISALSCTKIFIKIKDCENKESESFLYWYDEEKAYNFFNASIGKTNRRSVKAKKKLVQDKYEDKKFIQELKNIVESNSINSKNVNVFTDNENDENELKINEHINVKSKNNLIKTSK